MSSPNSDVEPYPQIQLQLEMGHVKTEPRLNEVIRMGLIIQDDLCSYKKRGN